MRHDATLLGQTAKRAAAERYNLVARALHWVIALLIGGLYLTDQMRDFYDRGSPERHWWLGAHASLGMTVLALTALRLFWRLASKAPKPIPASPMMGLGARLGHLALYGFSFALPLSGYLRLASGGAGVPFYGLTIPSPTGKSDTLHYIGGLLHNEFWTNLLLLLIGLHAAAALYHHFILKDGTLKRMA